MFSRVPPAFAANKLCSTILKEIKFLKLKFTRITDLYSSCHEVSLDFWGGGGGGKGLKNNGLLSFAQYFQCDFQYPDNACLNIPQNY